MGTKLEHAKRAGTCPECGNTWIIGDTIFWDNKAKNSAGGNVTCSSEVCFKEHGGSITPFTPRTPSSTGYKPYTRESNDLTFILPVKEKNEGLDKAAVDIKQVIARADLVVGELYPNLKKTSDTYGQIRSRIADQIIALKGQS